MTTTLPTSTFQTHEGPPAQPPGPDTLDVTIVLRCYNELDHVPVELARIATAMDASPLSHEIPPIDDTLWVLTAAQARFQHLREIAFRRNGGSGLWLLGIGVVNALVDLVRFPLRIATSTLLLIVAGLLVGAPARLLDLIVRSRVD